MKPVIEDTKEERDRLFSSIKASFAVLERAIGRVPEKIVRGSYQAAQDWKRNAITAKKMIDAGVPNGYGAARMAKLLDKARALEGLLV